MLAGVQPFDAGYVPLAMPRNRAKHRGGPVTDFTPECKFHRSEFFPADKFRLRRY